MRRFVATAACIGLAVALGPSVGACSLGDGVGSVQGDLNIPDCWEGKFNLQPDFFAAVPYGTAPALQSLTLRIQNGGDFEVFSDGLVVLVDNTQLVRGNASLGYPGELGQPLKVALPPNVTPPGVPVVAVANPPIVHAALYLQRTCHTQLDALFAIDQVALNSNGTCADEPDAGATAALPVQCGATGIVSTPDGGTAGPSDASSDAVSEGGADASTPAPGPDASAGSPPPYTGRVGTSTFTFTHLFDGVLDEKDSAQRLNEGSFDLYLADPREICPGGGGPPPPCRAHLTGTFKFYFERGRPAQPFP